MNREKGIVICGFPGIGKSYIANVINNDATTNIEVCDSDSSKYFWIYDENGNKTEERNPEFPKNYIERIKELIKEKDIVFCSTDKDVIQSLIDNNIPFALAYPCKELKDYYIKTISERKTGLNSESFVKMLEENFDNFVDDCMKVPFSENDEGGCRITVVFSNDEDVSKRHISKTDIEVFLSIEEMHKVID